MSVVTEDVDVFQIDDYTQASDWEVLVSTVENALENDLKIARKYDEPYVPVSEEEFRNGHWLFNECTIDHRDFKATLQHHKLEVSSAKQDTVKDSDTNQTDEQTVEPAAARCEDLANQKLHETMVRFPVCYHDMSTSAFDFPRSNEHMIVRCYGLREFLVVEPATDEKRRGLISEESTLRMILSCVRVALSNVDCTLPLFLSIGEPWRMMYEGICVSRDFATHFQMAHLHRAPAACGSLAGVIQLFRERLSTGICGGVGSTQSDENSDVADRLPSILIAVRYSFVLTAPLCDFGQLLEAHRDRLSVTDVSSRKSAEPELPPRFEVRFRTRSSVIEALHLSTVWPSLSELFAVDTEHYTELDAASAPNWTASIRFRKPLHLVGSFCNALRCLLHSTDESIRHRAAFATNEDSRSKTGDDFLVLSSAKMAALTAYIFAEQEEQEGESNAARVHTNDPAEDRDAESETEAETADLNQEGRAWFSSLPNRLKTAPLAERQSIVHRLAFVALQLAIWSADGNLEASLSDALLAVWRAFLRGLRDRLENDFLIPAVESGAPNTGYCLLYQKLQKLNCCIAKRCEQSLNALERTATQSRIVDMDESSSVGSSAKRARSVGPASNATADGEDEFFECAETIEEALAPAVDEVKPEGRLHRCGDWRLRRTNEPLYVPETQEAAPLTEDEVAEQQRVLASLGTDERSREVRARMQCAQLLSDMQAFRAANPAAEFEDFLAWHSPRDLVPVRRNLDDGSTSSVDGSVIQSAEGGMDVDAAESEAIEYELSERMKQAGNAWIETWQRAVPLAASQQKRLFDETNEAEKVLHSLERMPLGSLVDEQLIPALLHAALMRMATDDRLLPRLRNSAVFLADQVAQAAAELLASASEALDVETSTPESLAAAQASRSRARRDKFIELIRKFEIIEVMVTKRDELVSLFELARVLDAQAQSNTDSETNTSTVTVTEEAISTLVHDLLHRHDVMLTTAEPADASLIHLLQRTVRALHELAEFERGDNDREFMFTEKQDAASGSGSGNGVGSGKAKHAIAPSLTTLLGKPVSREMILRTVLARPNLHTSIPTPQRFYAYLSDEECRFAAAVTEDSIFS